MGSTCQWVLARGGSIRFLCTIFLLINVFVLGHEKDRRRQSLCDALTMSKYTQSTTCIHE